MADVTAVCIQQLPHGGFVVTDYPASPGMFSAFLFASTDLEGALHFVRLKFEPAQLVIVEDRHA